jgi:hypothetical protein
MCNITETALTVFCDKTLINRDPTLKMHRKPSVIGTVVKRDSI